MVVQVSQATGKGVWVNAPVSATVSWPANETSYVYEWATLLRDGNAATGNKGIPDGAPIYIEHSNEVRGALARRRSLRRCLSSHQGALFLGPGLARSGTTDLVRWEACTDGSDTYGGTRCTLVPCRGAVHLEQARGAR